MVLLLGQEDGVLYKTIRGGEETEKKEIEKTFAINHKNNAD